MLLRCAWCWDAGNRSADIVGKVDNLFMLLGIDMHQAMLSHLWGGIRYQPSQMDEQVDNLFMLLGIDMHQAMLTHLWGGIRYQPSQVSEQVAAHAL